ncbi:zinc finger, CCHC-type [Artemisia annua]|uniref:Zinc finger, CCHC-type n=1 Tax=Artemisia annua TaxID=35608 RepID=A0A2U1LBN9_ARTAN|nr:zinc finger, CCHC-type [Artemisia annua]
MNRWENTISEVHQMFVTVENNIPSKNPEALGKDKGVARKKIPAPPKRENLTNNVDCFHCGSKGHRRINCPSYLVELKKGKARDTNKSTDIEAINAYELFLFLHPVPNLASIGTDSGTQGW